MDIEMEFAFDAAAFAGQTIVVFEYLYQDEIEIGRHADLDDLMQQLYVKDAEQQSGEKKENNSGKENVPRTGDMSDPLSVAAAAAGAGSAAMLLAVRMREKRRRR